MHRSEMYSSMDFSQTEDIQISNIIPQQTNPEHLHFQKSPYISIFTPMIAIILTFLARNSSDF